MKIFLHILLLCALQPAMVHAQQLLPLDEAAEEPSFFLFRARLQEALAARDTSFLYAQLSPDVLNSFGGDGGIDEFKTMWQPEAPQSPLWRTLARILAVGGIFIGDGPNRMFLAPYYTAAWPDTLDVFTHGVLLGENVRVRATPSLEAEVLATSSYEIVRLVDHTRHEGPSENWHAVRLPGGREGYVATRYVGSPVGYRAGFRKKGGRWTLTFLVAGD